MMHGFWDIKCKKQSLLSLWVIFCPLTLRTTKKIKIFKKLKKTLVKYYHFTLVYHKWQPYNVWFLRYQIRQSIICHFVLLFALVYQVYHKWQSYDTWFLRFLRYQLQQTDFSVILGHFLPFYSPKSPKNENIKNMKTPGDIIILHKCTKTHDQRLYCSWDIVCGWRNCYFSFWAIFCPFTLLTARKMKISIKWKKYLQISSFWTSVPKIMIICWIF